MTKKERKECERDLLFYLKYYSSLKPRFRCLDKVIQDLLEKLEEDN